MTSDGASAGVTCACGEPLLDDLRRDTIELSGTELVYRRTTDYVLCESCGEIHSIGHLRRTELN